MPSGRRNDGGSTSRFNAAREHTGARLVFNDGPNRRRSVLRPMATVERGIDYRADGGVGGGGLKAGSYSTCLWRLDVSDKQGRGGGGHALP